MKPAGDNNPACPCCLKHEADYLFSHRFTLIMGKERSLDYDARYWTCKQCDHTWYMPGDGAINEKALYQYYSSKTYLPNEMLPGDRQHRSLRTLAQAVSVFLSEHLSEKSENKGGKRLTILELGGGDGAFARVFGEVSSAIPMEYLIYDFGKFADKPGCNYRRISDLSEIKGRSMDVVISRHTLEHVVSLDDFVASIAGLLAENGACYIEVPCWTLPHHSVDELNAEHFQHFTHKSMDVLFARNPHLVPSGDFSIYLKDYYTPHRLLGKFYTKSRDFVRERGSLKQGEAFRNRCLDGRAKLGRLAEHVRQRLDKGETVGFHGASITLEDFLINEGTGLSEAKKVFLFDGSVEKHGCRVGGMLVHKPDEAFAGKLDVVISFSSFVPEIAAAWKRLGFGGAVLSYLDFDRALSQGSEER